MYKHIFACLCTIALNLNMLAQPFIAIDTISTPWLSLYNNLDYNDSLTINTAVPFTNNSLDNSNINANHYLFITLKNNSAITDSIMYYCGHWVNYEAYKIYPNDSIAPLTVTLTYNNAINNYTPILTIVVPAKQSVRIAFKLNIRSFNFNYVNPYLIKPNYLSEFNYNYYINSQKKYVVFTIFTVGVLFVIFLYALISWLRQKTKDFFYYSLYTLFFIIYFLLRLTALLKTDYSILQHNLLLNHIVLNMGYIFYGSFIKHFLDETKTKKLLHAIFGIFNYVIITYLIVDYLLLYHFNLAHLSINLFIIVRYFLLAFSLYVAVYLFLSADKLNYYIATGILLLFTFGFISLLFSTPNITKASFNIFFDIRITLYQIGIIFELLFFSISLQYKTKLKAKNAIIYTEQLKLRSEKIELETFKQILAAKDNERNRIAQEIHDDLGSGLTSIRLLSEIAKSKQQQQQGSTTPELEKISVTASELVDNMNEIIWSINAKNDYLHNLTAYLRRYVVTYFDTYNTITVYTNINNPPTNVEIDGNFRRSIFLTVKEALHNIIKHADATQIHFNLEASNTQLVITITDNGKGFTQKPDNEFSNGLNNMRERIASLKGLCIITTQPSTSVLIHVPLPLHKPLSIPA